MTDHPHARVGGEPEHRVAERVEERQDPDQAVVGQDAIDLGDRLDVGIDVEMREDHALGIARAAAAEDDRRRVVERRRCARRRQKRSSIRTGARNASAEREPAVSEP